MHKLPFAHLSIAFAGLAAACADDGGDPTPAAFDDSEVIVSFADDVVVPTYALLATRAAELATAVDTLAADPTQANLTAAQEAWVATRRPWEQSEGFLFGPVDSFGYDPAMDSWPVNRTDLDAVIAGDDELTQAYVSSLSETQKGFHTIEYLLFGEENARDVAELGARELEYAVAIAAELADVAALLEASWTTTVEDRPPYRDLLATAGEEGNTTYPTLAVAAQEIVGGMIGICDEVANGKIADPYDAHDPNLVESQFSFNSLLDFQDNMRSVENAYLGAVPDAGTSGRGLAAWVAERDAALDTRIRAEITASIAAIAAIPEPFRDAISDPDAADEIEAAQAAIRTLQNTLEGELLPLVTQ